MPYTQELLTELRTAERQLQEIITSSTQLSAQQNETESVKQELDKLEEDAVVYRMVGPVLVKQALSECKETVARRAEFIHNELTKADKLAGELLEKANDTARKLNAETA